MIFALGPTSRSTAAPLDQRIVDAALGVYFEGVTEDIAERLVGPDGVPALLDLLAEPSFPRRDNVVAFLFHLGGPESTEALLDYFAAPPAPTEIPEEDRALLLAPQALGKIASRGDPRALNALLAMARDDPDTGILAAATARAADPSRLRTDLLRMTLRGLGFSQAPEARTLLDHTAQGRKLPAAPGRNLAEDAVQALDLMSDQERSEPPAASPYLPLSSYLDVSARAHQTPLDFANHVDLSDPMTDTRLDRVLAHGSYLMGREDFDGDIACCVTFVRSGTAQVFGTPDDGLDIINNATTMSTVLNAAPQRVKVVRAINHCGGVTPNVIGCALTPGKSMVVVRLVSMHNESILWMHEYGHNTGLAHHPDLGFIMHGSASPWNAGITQAECNRFHAPSFSTQIALTDIGTCADTDADRVHDAIDNCPVVANYEQENSDGQPPGDACIDMCGNRVLDAGEECDDGNLDEVDGCTNACTVCGNGIITPPEECDDGNDDPADGCTNACRICGNGSITEPEQCDDGNADPGDGCTNACTLCGDGVVTFPEQCDDGNDDPYDGCTNACTLCGDSVVTWPEECDDGNLDPFDGCKIACTICGNGTVTSPEECDDGNSNPADGCTNDCTFCGNGIVTPPEECDDGNLNPFDGCEPTCMLSPTHDSVLLPLKPLTVKLRAGRTEVFRRIRIKVRNADIRPVKEAPGHEIRLAIDLGTCPAGIVASGPDFDRKTPGDQDATVVAGGKTATATLELRIDDSFTSASKHSPDRCALTVTATSVDAYDAIASNNATPLEINVVDGNDVDPQVLHQSAIESAKPVRMRIARGKSHAARTVVLKAVNADVGESTGHPIVVDTSDGNCPAGTIGVADFGRNAAESRNVRSVAGGKVGAFKIPLSVASGSFVSGSALSPARCTAVISVTGPGGDGNVANDSTQLVIDVVDQNDF